MRAMRISTYMLLCVCILARDKMPINIECQTCNRHNTYARKQSLPRDSRAAQATGVKVACDRITHASPAGRRARNAQQQRACCTRLVTDGELSTKAP